MAVQFAGSLCFQSVAQHAGLSVVVELQSLHILWCRTEIDIVGEVVQIGFHLYLPPLVGPADSGIYLVGLFGVELAVALLVAENVVINTVSSQFFGDWYAERLADVGFHDPCP